MWTRAIDVPKKSADEILERFDKTHPELKRLVVLQLFLDIKALKYQLDHPQMEGKTGPRRNK